VLEQRTVTRILGARITKTKRTRLRLSGGASISTSPIRSRFDDHSGGFSTPSSRDGGSAPTTRDRISRSPIRASDRGPNVSPGGNPRRRRFPFTDIRTCPDTHTPRHGHGDTFVLRLCSAFLPTRSSARRDVHFGPHPIPPTISLGDVRLEFWRSPTMISSSSRVGETLRSSTGIKVLTITRSIGHRTVTVTIPRTPTRR